MKRPRAPANSRAPAFILGAPLPGAALRAWRQQIAAFRSADPVWVQRRQLPGTLVNEVFGFLDVNLAGIAGVELWAQRR